MTGTRAEYGLLVPVMELVKKDPKLALQLLVTGSHLSEKFGMTISEIERDGFSIDERIEILSNDDTDLGMAKAISVGIIGFASAFKSLNPDLIVLLGDRFEIFAAATAATLVRIPIAHLHGGETTEALLDEAFRHSITKMSHLHFVSTEEYKNRVIQLGENPERVFCVGALGAEIARGIATLTKKELETLLGITFVGKKILVTFHPVTLEQSQTKAQLEELFASLSHLLDATIIFTFPNADEGGGEIIDLIKAFTSKRPNTYAFASLGQLMYLSLIKCVDVVVGNSSSGLIEVPTFGKPTVNVGDRQKGRVRGKTVIDCLPTESDITRALELALARDFNGEWGGGANPYYQLGTSNRIKKIISETNLEGLLKKQFYRVNNQCE